jgi:hypothetical protein
MTTLTPGAVFNLARDAGLDSAGAVVAMAIATAESGLRTDALGDLTIQTAKWGPSVGLWQIRSVKAESGRGTPRDATRLTDPAFNARSMVAISGAGKNWNPWSTYTSKSYRRYLTVTPGPAPLTPAIDAATGAVTGALGDAKKAVTDAAGALNPFDGWDTKASTVVLKATFVLAGVTLVIIGGLRLVIPAAAGLTKEFL